MGQGDGIYAATSKRLVMGVTGAKNMQIIPLVQEIRRTITYLSNHKTSE
jgi:hypothetical protein